MSDPVVEARLVAAPAAVLASLTAHVAAAGGAIEAVDGFGTVVTWRAFDAHVDLVTLQAEIAPDPEPGITRLLVRRVDSALEAALDCAPSPAEDHTARDAG